MSRGNRPRPRSWQQPAILLLAGLSLVGAVAGCSDQPQVEKQGSAPGGESDPLARFWRVFRAASSARREGARDRAMALYSDALDLDPDHGDSRYYLGQLRYLRGEIAAAVGDFERLAKQEPGGLRAWQQLSLVRGQPRPGWVPDLEAAARAATQALDLNRSESLNHLLLARWAAYAGDTAAGRYHAEDALGHNPELAAAQALRVWLDSPTSAGRTNPGPWLPALGARYPVDMNDDGVADLLLLGRPGGPAVLTVTEGGEAVLLPAARRLRAWEYSERRAGPWPVPAAGVIVRGDGVERVVLVGGGAARGARLYERHGQVFAEVPEALPDLPGTPIVATADFDADGRDELVLGNVALNARERDEERIGVRVLRFGALGRFEPVGIEIPGPIWAVAAADLDGDGDLDLVVAGEAPRAAADAGTPTAEAGPSTATELRVWLNESGNLRAGAVLPVAGPFAVRGLATADLNDDGAMDIYAFAGDAAPERATGDWLWLGSPGGYTQPGAAIETGHATLAAWPLGGRLLLAKGGAVPGDPRRYELLRLR